MNNRDVPPAPVAQREGSLLALAVLALVVGAASGLIGALFRLSLEWADGLRDRLISWAHGGGFVGLLFVIGFAAAAVAIAAWLVRRVSPLASGSGIPHVELVLEGQLPPAPPVLLIVKFIGGWLAIGFGLALGREGPSVQMGANVASLIGKICRCSWPDCRVLLAAGAGAGLATAFNSPIAGAVFVLEELVRKFELRIAIAALGASTAAISVARVFLGDAPDFQVQSFAFSSAPILLYMTLGVLAGFAGVAYNRTLLGALAAMDRLARFPLELRAAVVGGGVGALAFFAPGVVGGGDPLTQAALAGVPALAMLPILFLVRFELGAISYAAGTPGGLFAPLLVLGAQLGLFFGLICRLGLPALDVTPEAFAVVGMGALFTAIVRAPLTGIVLVIEMTGSFVLLLPLLAACFGAMLVATLLRDQPIYDSLRERTLRSITGR